MMSSAGVINGGGSGGGGGFVVGNDGIAGKVRPVSWSESDPDDGRSNGIPSVATVSRGAREGEAGEAGGGGVGGGGERGGGGLKRGREEEEEEDGSQWLAGSGGDIENSNAVESGSASADEDEGDNAVDMYLIGEAAEGETEE